MNKFNSFWGLIEVLHEDVSITDYTKNSALVKMLSICKNTKNEKILTVPYTRNMTGNPYAFLDESYSYEMVPVTNPFCSQNYEKQMTDEEINNHVKVSLKLLSINFPWIRSEGD